MCFLVEVAFWGVIVLLVWTFLSKVSKTRGGGGDMELAGLINGSESFYHECHCRLINICFLL